MVRRLSRPVVLAVFAGTAAAHDSGAQLRADSSGVVATQTDTNAELQVIEVRASDDSAATVHFRDIVVGRDHGATIEILSGVNQGEQVATIGSQVFSEGQRVRIAAAVTDSSTVVGSDSAIVQRIGQR